MAMNFLYSTFVAPEPSLSQEHRDSIIKLKDRLDTSQQISDRRAALLAIKSLAAEYRQLVGEICLDSLTNSLTRDRGDVSSINACLEIFLILFALEDQEDKDDPGVRFSNTFSKKVESVSALLDCFEEKDFYIRYHGINVLQSLHSSAPGPIQASLLASPMSISRLVELLDDERDIIRNDGLLLITAVTETNAELQKIVAFQNVFERLLDMIQGESGLEGGIVVEDCLILISNLLQNNASNQSYFRETSCIQKLLEHLTIAGEQMEAMDWENPQKVSNVTNFLHLLRLLVLPRGTHTKANQGIMGKCGLVMALVHLLAVPVLPVVVQSQALFALGDAILDSRPNQDLVGAATLETTLEPFIVYIVSIVLDGAADNTWRFGACYVFQCYVSGNPDAQLALASTLRRPPGLVESDGRTVGSIILKSLFEDSSDRLGRWLASVLISRLLWDNQDCKQLVLQIQLGTGEDAIGLLGAILQRVMGLVEDGDDHWLLGGHLALLSFWLEGCPESASELLRNGAGFQFVIQLAHPDSGSKPLVQGIASFLLALLYQANQTNNSQMSSATLRTIVLKRVGTENLYNSLARLKDSPEFRMAQPWSQLPANPSADVTDYQFVEFFKSHSGPTMKLMVESPKLVEEVPSKTTPQAPHPTDEKYLVMEARIRELETSETTLTEEVRKLRLALEKADNYIQHLLKKAECPESENPLLKKAESPESTNPLLNIAESPESTNPLLKLKVDGASETQASTPISPANSVRPPPKNKRVMFPILAETPSRTSSGTVSPLSHYHHPPPVEYAISTPVSATSPIARPTPPQDSRPISPIATATPPTGTSTPTHHGNQTIFNL